MVVRPHEMPPCPQCSGATERYYPIGAATSGVLPDEIIGGRWYENLGHEPVYITSRSQLKRELAARGLVEKVRHVSEQGSDRSRFTTRWI